MFLAGVGSVLARGEKQAVFLSLAGVGGSFKRNSDHMRILGNVSLSVRGKRFYILLKPSKSKGSALLGVVKNVSHTSDKRVAVRNRLVRGVAIGHLDRCQEGRLKCIFRVCGLVPGLAIHRGVRINTCLDSRTLSMSRLLSALNLSTRRGGLPGRLSNNRRRHATVNETVIGGPSVLLYSRPANTLSCGASGRVLGLVRAIGRGCNGAIMVMARGSTVGSVTSRIIQVHSNVVQGGCLGSRGIDTRRLS